MRWLLLLPSSSWLLIILSSNSPSSWTANAVPVAGAAAAGSATPTTTGTASAFASVHYVGCGARRRRPSTTGRCAPSFFSCSPSSQHLLSSSSSSLQPQLLQIRWIARPPSSSFDVASMSSSSSTPPSSTPSSVRGGIRHNGKRRRGSSLSASATATDYSIGDDDETSANKEKEDYTAEPTKPKGGLGEGDTNSHILVLGGTGLVGSAIVETLSARNIPYIATSSSRGVRPSSSSLVVGETIKLDLTSPAASTQISSLCRSYNVVAVISTVGSLGTSDDETINASAGTAALAASKVDGVKRFVVIGNAPKVRELSKSVPFLKGYARGKESAERIIKDTFGGGAKGAAAATNGGESNKGGGEEEEEQQRSFCIVQPTFIYGGKTLELTPPRVPTALGQVAEDVLGLYPLRSLADAVPGPLGIALNPPVSAEAVARAAVNAALGWVTKTELATEEDIVMASSMRRRRRMPPIAAASTVVASASADAGENDTAVAHAEGENEDEQPEKQQRREEIKRRLIDDHATLGKDRCISLLEELEQLPPPVASVVSATPPQSCNNNKRLLPLDGRWNFVVDVDPNELGIDRILQELLANATNPLSKLLRPVFHLNDVRMDVSDGAKIVRIVASTSILGKKTDLVVTTSLSSPPDDADDDGWLYYGSSSCGDGTVLLETFEGVSIDGINLPYPEAWKRTRYMEFSYADDDMLIARGAGREPHFLLRDR